MKIDESVLSEQDKKDIKKAKLIYSGELLLFAIIFAVLGILFLLAVIKVREWKRWLFTIGPLVGGAWLIADFIWALVSKKRRAKVSLIDKIVVLPAGLAAMTFDIVALCNNWLLNPTEVSDLWYRYMVGSLLCYYAASYLFQSIYHWFNPIPGLFDVALAPEDEEPKPEGEEKPVEEVNPIEESPVEEIPSEGEESKE